MDPYFAVGMLSVIAIGGVFAARSHRATAPTLSTVPARVTSRFDSLRLGRTLGPPTHGVRVAEFADYQCSACAAAHRANWSFLQRLAQGGKITYTVYDLPLPSHGNAIPAAVIAQCVADDAPQNFWSYRDALFAHQHEWEAAYPVEPRLLAIAGQVGVDTVVVRACVQHEAESRGHALREGWATASAEDMSYVPVWSVDGHVVPWGELPARVEAAIERAQ